MFSRFFIERPIFANVIAIVTVIVGLVTLFLLPVQQFPDITPPTVQVTAMYPGASAMVLAETVASPIEEQVNGVEGMLYMSSTCSSSGNYKLIVTFDIGTDPDTAQILVQNRVAMAEPLLPQDVRREGIQVQKQSTAIVTIATLTSPGGQFDSLFLANYATANLQDELNRLPGSGGTRVFGSSNYAMRIWLDPQELQYRDLTVEDVSNAIRSQNIQAAAGQLGEPPALPNTGFQYTITAQGRLDEVEQFQNIIVKTGQDGRLTFLKDISRVEMGSQDYTIYCAKDGEPAAGVAVYQLPGANALALSTAVHAKMAELAELFPEGLEYGIPFDTTVFVRSSINEVYKTLAIAGVLVLIVILVFLQDWRAVLVPATTVPVTIIGAFIFMAALGFTVNMLTLFGLVLAIGIVVDDAIVIVENSSHHIEAGMDPKSATIKAMGELMGPIIAVTLVLMAVFLPTTFLGGITGQLYRQFALTIAATALISAMNALTLKPAQCAVYLRKRERKLNLFFRGFNAVYGVAERMYVGTVRTMVRFALPTMVLFLAMLGGTIWWYISLPTGFLPPEDQGYLIVSVQLPDAASLGRTQEVTGNISEMLKRQPGVANTVTIGGYEFIDQTTSSNTATIYVVLEDWSIRAKEGLSLRELYPKLEAQFREIQEARVFAIVPPSIRGLGVAGGFQLELEDQRGVGLDEMQSVAERIIDDATSEPSLSNLQTTFRAGVPQLFVDVDRVKVASMGIELNEVFGAMQGYLGSYYVNEFNKFDRTYQVRLQADRQYRATVDDLLELNVRNRQGDMVPLATLVDVRRSYGPQIVSRYEQYPSAMILGRTPFGYSSGESLAAMERLAAKNVPDGMAYEWTGMAFQESQLGEQPLILFGLAILMVYLVLAAQFESWTSPAAVILVVPLALLGATAATWLLPLGNNVYAQIGVVLVLALAAKNAILIVEFARDLRAEGMSIPEAAVEASRKRFRPILMTSFAFILGVFPLVIAQGAGASSRISLGAAVFGGMISSTFLAVLFVPVFYTVMQRVSEWWSGGE